MKKSGRGNQEKRREEKGREGKRREEKRRGLEKRERKLEKNRKAESQRWKKRRLLQEARDMLAEMDAGLGTTTAMRRDDETTTKKNDTMKTVRCYEENTETKAGRGREFPPVHVRERDLMIGVGRNTSTTERTTTDAIEFQGPATSKATANMISARAGGKHSCRRKILRGKVMIGIKSNASTTRRTTTETAESQENATASKAATASSRNV